MKAFAKNILVCNFLDDESFFAYKQSSVSIFLDSSVSVGLTFDSSATANGLITTTNELLIRMLPFCSCQFPHKKNDILSANSSCCVKENCHATFSKITPG